MWQNSALCVFKYFLYEFGIIITRRSFSSLKNHLKSLQIFSARRKCSHRLAVKNVQKYTVLTIWHLPKHQLPNVGMTHEVSHFSVREMHLQCKYNVWISITKVLQVSAQGFWRDLSVCIIRYWDSETTEQFALGATRGENWDNFLLSTIFIFHLTCEFLVTLRIGYICFDLLSRFAASQ